MKECWYYTFDKFFSFHETYWAHMKSIALSASIALPDNPADCRDASWRLVRGYLSHPEAIFKNEETIQMIKQIRGHYADSIV